MKPKKQVSLKITLLSFSTEPLSATTRLPSQSHGLRIIFLLLHPWTLRSISLTSIPTYPCKILGVPSPRPIRFVSVREYIYRSSYLTLSTLVSNAHLVYKCTNLYVRITSAKHEIFVIHLLYKYGNIAQYMVESILLHEYPNNYCVFYCVLTFLNNCGFYYVFTRTLMF